MVANNFDDYSDEELAEIAFGKQSSKQAMDDFADYSDEELMKIAGKNKGALDYAGEIATEVISPKYYPMYGQAVGEALATPFGPAAMVAGGGAGQVVGEAAKGIVKNIESIARDPYKFYEDLSRLPTKEQVIEEIKKYGEAFVLGASASAAGGIAGKAVGKLANTPLAKKAVEKLANTAPAKKVSGIAGKAVDLVNEIPQKAASFIRAPELKPNAVDIVQAGKDLGITVTPAMVTDSKFIQRLEESLASSPSFLGRGIEEKRKAVAEAMKKVVEETTDTGINLTRNQIGDTVKSGLVAEVGEKIAPSSMAFQEVAESTRSIPLSEKSIKTVTKNIRNIPEYRLTNGEGKPARYVKFLENAESADDIKRISTLIGQDIRGKIDPAEKYILRQMQTKIRNLEENSIMRAAVTQAREGGMREATGKKIGSDIVSMLKTARKEYAEVAGSLKDIAKDANIKITNPVSFVDEVEMLPVEKVQDKFFNVDNIRLLENVKKQFPEQYELMRKGQIKQIAESAADHSRTGQGDLSPHKFLKTIRTLSPEAKSMVFSKDAIKTIDALDTINKSLPDKFLTSPTATAGEYIRVIQAQIESIPRYVLYKGASSNLAREASKNVEGFLLKVPKLAQLKKMDPNTFNSIVQRTAAGLVSSSSKNKESEQ